MPKQAMVSKFETMEFDKMVAFTPKVTDVAQRCNGHEESGAVDLSGDTGMMDVDACGESAKVLAQPFVESLNCGQTLFDNRQNKGTKIETHFNMHGEVKSPFPLVGCSSINRARARENTPDRMIKNSKNLAKVTEHPVSKEYFMTKIDELGEGFNHDVVRRLTQIMKEIDAGLVVLAPYNEIEGIHQHVSDNYHFEKPLGKNGKPANVLDSDFPYKYKEFANHDIGDVMTDEFGDEICKDGGIGVSRSGMVVCAAKIFRPNHCHVTWPNRGARHMAAVGIASQLEKGVVYVRSQWGTLHVMTSHSAVSEVGPIAYRLRPELD